MIEASDRIKPSAISEHAYAEFNMSIFHQLRAIGAPTTGESGSISFSGIFL